MKIIEPCWELLFLNYDFQFSTNWFDSVQFSLSSLRAAERHYFSTQMSIHHLNDLVSNIWIKQTFSQSFQNTAFSDNTWQSWRKLLFFTYFRHKIVYLWCEIIKEEGRQLQNDKTIKVTFNYNEKIIYLSTWDQNIVLWIIKQGFQTCSKSEHIM